MVCKAPKCYKTLKAKCTTPNPWVVFNTKNKGKTALEKKTLYKQFLEKYDAIKKTGDETAYRAALCLGRPPTMKLAPSKPSIISRFVRKLMTERDEIELGCKLTPNLVGFFEMFVPSSIVGSSLNPCQVIAKHLLSKCVPREDLKYYTLQDKIATGAYGLVMNGTFKKKPIVIKVIPVHARSQYLLSFTADGQQYKLKSVPERNIVRETKIQKAIGNVRFDDFHTPKVYGDTIIQSKTSTSKRIAVVVMEKVEDTIDLKDLSDAQKSKYIARIPALIHKLHTKGFIHGDLHMYNVLFTNTKPYVIDFGRSVNVKDTLIRDKDDLMMLKVMDYIIPLEMIWRNAGYGDLEAIVGMSRAYLDAIYKTKPIHDAINKLMDQIPNEAFKIEARDVLSPLPATPTVSQLRDRHDSINNLFVNYYYSMSRSWIHVLEI